MSSRKQKRYGSGGSKHTKNANANRRNGKAWKLRVCGVQHAPTADGVGCALDDNHRAARGL